MESHKVSRLADRQDSPTLDNSARGDREQPDGFTQGQPDLIHEHRNRGSHG
jgi:hypothetical protein